MPVIGSDPFISVFGGAPSHTETHYVEHLRAVIRAGFSPVLCKPGTKEPACVLSAAGAKKADREAQQRALAGNPAARVDRIRHACGMKHVLDDPAKVGAVVKRLAEIYPGAQLNVALHLGRSRMLVVDADTPAERQAFGADWMLHSLGDLLPNVPGITVESPGSFDIKTQSWIHWGGGHWWMPLPEGFDLPPGKVLKGQGGWAVMYGESYALVPPATRAEGTYRLVGGTTPPPTWLLEQLTAAGAQRSQVTRDRTAAAAGGPIDQWSADTSWASLLEPQGWIETSMVEGSCGCPIWTAPGDHASPKSATAHDLSCARFDVSEGWGPLKIWTDHPPDGLPSSGAVTKLQFVAATGYDGDDGAAIRGLGIAQLQAPSAWGVPAEWSAVPPQGSAPLTGVQPTDPFGVPSGPPPDPSVPLAAQVPTEQPESAWDALNLGPFLDGTYTTAKAALLHRTDGLALFYPGLTHSVYGESESGKSWIALVAVAEVIKDRGHALWVDFESDAGTVCARLLLLGCTPVQILTGFHYVAPWSKPSTEEDQRAWFGRTLNRRYDIAVIDAMAGALSLFGLKADSEADITNFYRVMPDMITARTGAAVVTVDHVVKDKETRGRWPSGSERKVSALTGAAFSIRRIEPFGEGSRGCSGVWIAKDRAGGLRGHAGAGDRDGMQQIGVFILDSSVPAVFTAIIEPQPVKDTDGTERQDALIQAITAYLRNYSGSTVRAIREAVPGQAAAVGAALAVMVASGSVMVETHGRAHLHRLADPLNIVDMPDSTARE